MARTPFGRKSLFRRQGRARPRHRTIIVCYDGERTEAEYFAGWRRALGNVGVVLRPYFVESGGNALTAVRSAIEIKSDDSDHDEFWCVCDVDDTSAGDLAAAKAAAARAGIVLCLSNRCFEIWLASHWARISTAPIMNEREARRLVSRHYPPFERGPKHIPFSVLHPMTQDAISNSDWLSKRLYENPNTMVHQLIEKLHALLSAR